MRGIPAEVCAACAPRGKLVHVRQQLLLAALKVADTRQVRRSLKAVLVSRDVPV